MSDGVSAWFLVSETGEAMGHIYRTGAEATPAEGDVLEGGRGWTRAAVVSAEELRATCMQRRYKVVIRVIT